MTMKSFNARQRANTTGDTIPRPRFNNPDAFPHSGLQDDEKTPSRNNVRKRNNTVNANVGPPRPEWKAAPSPAFDFQLQKTTAQIVSSQPQENTPSDDRTTMIGVAVGTATTHRAVQHAPSRVVPSAAIDFDSMEVVGPTEAELSKPKPSKWKKISDFFKAKHSLQEQQHQLDHLFDELQLHDRPATSHEFRASPADSHPRQNHAAAAEVHAPWDDLEFEERMGKPARKTGKDVSKPSKGKEPRKLVKYVEPPKPNKKVQRQDRPSPNPSKPEAIFPSPPSEPPSTSGSLLAIEIPEVRLERYSVMFGNVLGNPPPSTLLARRSRTLGMLITHDEEEELEHSQSPLLRRATSPAATKSPTFTLFPTAPTSKPPNALHHRNIYRSTNSLLLTSRAPFQPHRLLQTASPGLMQYSGIDKAAIYSTDPQYASSPCASSPGFTALPNEIAYILNSFVDTKDDEPKEVQTNGFSFAGEKYFFVRADKNPDCLIGRKLQEGIVIYKTSSALFIVHHPSDVITSNVNEYVDGWARYLINAENAQG
ncbi:hypothetical protein ACJ72_05724 [Emergomyces africanus]|uniref:Profilin n=1 Tax=Emergomyces africanus TaxID=1955775 RepID=A0A1B7NT78_9EURO|nr:hypothetical protein ACJ72_05724 [Emergomyces africanus]